MTTVIGQYHWLPFRNDSGEDAPAHAVMRVTGTAVVGDQQVITVDKPNATFQRYYAINSTAAVPDGRVGRCTFGPPAIVRYDNSNTPAFGETWGAKPSSWDIFRGRPGFNILGVFTNTRVPTINLVHTLTYPVDVIKCTPDSNITAGSSGTASIYMNGADTTDMNITLFNDWPDNGQTLSAAKETIARFFGDESDGDGEWHQIERECE